ncbi:MAG: SDR family oxidoreductase [Marinobacter sp.]|uniref:SDR family oxidoreductase n=1 Tax=Marinobacter sp. TaxID=50741 RepID=UPI00299F2E81|nr:SDR family oxidoreductase [Marinobacter sp.]MDX1635118.1 SDR family oxidoreductase [Marinobacter sp.]
MNYMLITGAASGIGAATARRFAQAGWTLGLLDVNAEALEQLQARLGDKHWIRTCDVTDAESVTRAVADFGAFSGNQLHLLLNCAGILNIGQFEDIAMADHARIIDINVTGLMRVTHEAFPLLKATPGARVINMSSASATYGTPHFASYSASKFAVRGLTEALNIEWQAHDILVQDIMTPFVKTPMVEGQSFRAPVIERLGVRLSAEDLAEEIWKAHQGKEVHHLVGLQFKTLVASNKWLPTALTRSVMGYLSR